jgi:hypothetical protein
VFFLLLLLLLPLPLIYLPWFACFLSLPLRLSLVAHIQQDLELELAEVQQSKQDLEHVQQELRKQLFALKQENATLSESSGKLLNALQTTNADWAKKNEECQHIQRELDLLRSAQHRVSSPSSPSSLSMDPHAAPSSTDELCTEDDEHDSTPARTTLDAATNSSTRTAASPDSSSSSSSSSSPHQNDVVIIQLGEQLARAHQAVRKSALKMQLLMQEKEQVVLQMEILLLSLPAVGFLCLARTRALSCTRLPHVHFSLRNSLKISC